MALPKRRLTELCAYYQLTRTARDVYVEGESDVLILRRAFADAGLQHIVVYPVDVIEIDTLAAGGVPRSRKQQCIIVAQHLDSCENDVYGRAVCAVDADADHYLGTLPQGRFIVSTDLCDMICYFIEPNALRYSLDHLCGDRLDVNELIDEGLSLCFELFRLRLALQQLAPEAAFPEDPDDKCKVSAKGSLEVRLDVSALLDSILNPVGRMDAKVGAIELSQRFPRRDDLAPRMQINGHDFIALLRGVLKGRGKKGRFPSKLTCVAVEGYVFAAQPAIDFMASGFVTDIMSRLSPKAL